MGLALLAVRHGDKKLVDGTSWPLRQGPCTIGRSRDAHVPIDDPMRYVSRIHAVIVGTGDQYVLRVESPVNPVLVNGDVFNAGQTCVLVVGDHVVIGDYFFRVVEQLPEPAGVVAPAAAPVAPSPIVATPVNAAPALNPLVVVTPAAPVAPPQVTTPAEEQTGYSPYVPPVEVGELVAGAVESSAASPLNQDVPPDEITGASPYLLPPDEPLVIEVDIPLVDDKVFPIDELPGTVQIDVGMASELVVTPIPVAVLPTQEAAEQPSSLPAAAPTEPSAPTDATGMAKALAAFLAGAGIEGVTLDDAEAGAFLTECGALCRSAVEGVMALLLARATMRRELRASDLTMLAAMENNPFKMMESTDEALQFVFNPKTRQDGFMAPPQACAKSFKDLQAHEIAVMAGMRSALMGSMHRFDPPNVERRFDFASKGKSSLLANRRAQLWDFYVEYHSKTLDDALDNFDRVFGADFLRAYKQQLDKLR